jgi:hypothetical protein
MSSPIFRFCDFACKSNYFFLKHQKQYKICKLSEKYVPLHSDEQVENTDTDGILPADRLPNIKTSPTRQCGGSRK